MTLINSSNKYSAKKPGPIPNSKIEIDFCFSFEIFFKIIKENKIEHLITFYGDMDFPKALIIKLLLNRTVLGFLIKFLIKNPVIIFKILKLFI